MFAFLFDPISFFFDNFVAKPLHGPMIRKTTTRKTNQHNFMKRKIQQMSKHRTMHIIQITLKNRNNFKMNIHQKQISSKALIRTMFTINTMQINIKLTQMSTKMCTAMKNTIIQTIK